MTKDDWGIRPHSIGGWLAHVRITAWQCRCEKWNAAYQRKCRNCGRWKRDCRV